MCRLVGCDGLLLLLGFPVLDAKARRLHDSSAAGQGTSVVWRDSASGEASDREMKALCRRR